MSERFSPRVADDKPVLVARMSVIAGASGAALGAVRGLSLIHI